MVVFCAFMVGLHNLYWYYPKDVRKQVEIMDNNITTHAEKHFGMYVLLCPSEVKLYDVNNYNTLTQNKRIADAYF